MVMFPVYHPSIMCMFCFAVPWLLTSREERWQFIMHQITCCMQEHFFSPPLPTRLMGSFLPSRWMSVQYTPHYTRSVKEVQAIRLFVLIRRRQLVFLAFQLKWEHETANLTCIDVRVSRIAHYIPDAVIWPSWDGKERKGRIRRLV